MSLLPATSHANLLTPYYVEKAARLDELVQSATTLVAQLNTQVQKMDRYLRALEQAIQLEPIAGETEAPSMAE